MKLIFVYNADAGFLSGMLDSIHKTVSPETYQCALCRLTYGAFAMDRSWKDYLRALPIATEFFHRQEFQVAYPEATFPLPVILLDNDGTLSPLLSAEQMQALPDVNALIGALETALQSAGVI